MEKKSKSVMYVIVTLLFISLACGGVGLLFNLTRKPAETPNEEYKITFKYFIDEEEVTNEVKQETVRFENEEFEGVIDEKELYTFNRYECTNGIEGTWNSEEWKFTPTTLNTSTTCKLYFDKNIHEVTINSVNAKLPNGTTTQKFLIEKGKTKLINIVPTEGYKFDKIDCSNKNENNENKIVSSFDENTKDLNLSNVDLDDTCTVSFKINDFTAEVNVSNASVTEKTKSANYGGTVIFDITPSENYVFDSVECTNDQKGEYIDGKLQIKALSNNTVCVVQFKPLKFSVTLDIVNGTLLSTSKSPQSTTKGGTLTFGISPNDGYKFTGATLDCGNDKDATTKLIGDVLYFYNVTKELKCKYTLQAESTE